MSKQERDELRLVRTKAELVRTIASIFQMVMTSATLVILIWVNFVR